MEFLKKSVLSALTLLAAIGCGQIYGYTYRINKLERGEGKDKITVYTFWDYHLNNENDKKNAQALTAFAKKMNATVLVEAADRDATDDNPYFKNLYNIYKLNTLKNIPEKSLCSNFLDYLDAFYKDSINIDPRIGIDETKALVRNHNLSLVHNDAFTLLLDHQKILHELLQKEVDAITDEKVKKTCEKQLSDIASKITEVVTTCNTRPKTGHIIKKITLGICTKYLDIKAIATIFTHQPTVTKKEQTFIVAAGGDHCEHIEKTLESLGFSKTNLSNNPDLTEEEKPENFIEKRYLAEINPDEKTRKKLIEELDKAKHTYSPRPLPVANFIEILNPTLAPTAEPSQPLITTKAVWATSLIMGSLAALAICAYKFGPTL